MGGDRTGDAGAAAVHTVSALMNRVSQDFGVDVHSLLPVSGGSDATAAVWRAVTVAGDQYAVKLSQGGMDAGLLASTHLATRGVRGVLAPLRARTGQPWASHDGAQLSVTPWLVGHRGIEHGLGDNAWRSFGALMAEVHAVDVPGQLRSRLPVDRFGQDVTRPVRSLDARVRGGAVGEVAPAEPPVDAMARDLVGEWITAADTFMFLAEQAETLGHVMRDRPASDVLSHGDSHVGNVLIDDDGQVWLVDWDAVAIAPRERDFMFVTGGVLADAPVTKQQRSWFFDGYGPVDLDTTRLAYYMCARALEDITGWALSVLDPQLTQTERAEALAIFRGLLTPTGVVELALAAVEAEGTEE